MKVFYVKEDDIAINKIGANQGVLGMEEKVGVEECYSMLLGHHITKSYINPINKEVHCKVIICDECFDKAPINERLS